MITDEQLVGAARTITISGKDFDVYPLPDRDLVELTMWVRYRINKDARDQTAFSEDRTEAETIKREAFQRAQETEWFTQVGIGLLLNDSKGLIEVIFRMNRRNFKKDWFKDKFGTKSEITAEQLQNRSQIQDAFLAQNSVQTDLKDPPPKSSKSKKKS